MQRVRLLKRLTPMQQEVARLVGQGNNYYIVGERLHVSFKTVEFHAAKVANAIPGDLPAQMKIVMWYRGAPIEVLTGSWSLEEGDPLWVSDPSLMPPGRLGGT